MPRQQNPKLVLDAWTVDQLVELGSVNATVREAEAHFGVREGDLARFLAEHPDAQEAFQRGKALCRLTIRRKLAASDDPIVVAFLARSTLDLDAPPRQVDVQIARTVTDEAGR
ncbi:hypothetical protein [Microvirga massiliensis]|uniref:hypothetical protein n=1 Tax=Microvirga massiliensis TaxID=1033741 RepID=UPI00062B3366|nr:hypothetical protein [Microvirga massiliensis]